MKIGIAQINATVGDFPGNAKRILQAYRSCVDSGAELVVTPEMSLVGYPPRDLVLKTRFVEKCKQALDYLADETGDVPLLVGYVDYYNYQNSGKPLRNAAAFLHDGKVLHRFWKTLLPTYASFDEHRYFEPSKECKPFLWKGIKLGVTICEDIWVDDFLERPTYSRDPVSELTEKGAEVLINMSASPFQKGKPQDRANRLEVIACGAGIPVVFCNAIGANDSLIFDGHSMALDAEGNELCSLPGFESCFKVIDIFKSGKAPAEVRGSDVQDIYNALVVGLYDYVKKSGFETVCLGLTGGIDAALTASIAVHALGAENVVGLIMPSITTPQEHIDDAAALANNLKIRTEFVPISDTYMSTERSLSGLFQGMLVDETEENIQSRLRGMFLMAYSNKFNSLLLTSGNKSELSVGNCTIYGDMCGGLGVISDVPKTWVYSLANYVNEETPVIPLNTLMRPPSSGLVVGHQDIDHLPPYDVLDKILELYIEFQVSASDIIEDHQFAEETVRWVQRRVDLNEWKRRQAPLGLQVTSRAFGMSRRVPIVQRFVD